MKQKMILMKKIYIDKLKEIHEKMIIKKMN